jgi:hypothetical protein
VNIKDISIVTVRRKLLSSRKSNSLNLNNIDIFPELKSSKMNNQNMNETESKIWKNDNKRKSSGKISV